MSFPSGVLLTAAERAALLGLDEPRDRERRLWGDAGTSLRPVRREKTNVTVRLDADLIEWFKRNGGDARSWQARMNAVLRDHVDSQDDGE
ncbi:BrnA antitoxin family protein [Niveispirillum fermenti]|uniref:BrnA antitoxin family protein n=1 Tax=Niveispirillum fermenti TaxID=1233113 RepID=UPI003A86BD19